MPVLNGAAADTALIVTARVAVTVTVLVELPPTGTDPKSVGDPDSATVVGRPNPKSLPSRVPTKTRPPSVAGMLNLAAVPIGAEYRRLSVPPLGSAS